MPNYSGANGARLGVTPQDAQSLRPGQRFAPTQPATRKPAQRTPASTGGGYHERRVAELRQLAAGVPWALQDLAAELNARADVMDRLGHHEGMAASIAQKRHLQA